MMQQLWCAVKQARKQHAPERQEGRQALCAALCARQQRAIWHTCCSPEQQPQAHGCLQGLIELRHMKAHA